MTFEAILQIITSPKLRKILDDEARTPFQRAADLHAELIAGRGEAVETPRKTRAIKPKPDTETSNTGDGENG